MQKSFKNLKPGIFRASNNLCYTKLEKEIQYDENEKANAVLITNGQFKFFDDSDTIEDFGES